MAKAKASKYVKIAGICCIGTFLIIGGAFLKSKAHAEPLSQGAAQSGADKVIEIKEKMFIAQTNDIYLNSEDYLGKTIRLEGLFKTEQYAGEEAAPYCFVLRYGPGCCGYDGSAGFEVAWAPRTGISNDPQVSVLAPKYPKEDDWVEAVGTLSTYEEDGYPYIYLQLTSLNVKKDRGAEFVSQ
ncbi:MAG: hypothetical protein LBG27_07055 [Spirochaetaceae bacterium]|jgi:uncharacterized membrane protein YcgQ (UPF0703/DUF1980 family)|nr:hypothetical protein [Spirochaetaceae bacterium]